MNHSTIFSLSSYWNRHGAELLPFSINGSWLVRLRWVAVGGQCVTVAFVWLLLGIHIPVIPLVSVLASTSLSNLLFARWVRSREATATQPPDERLAHGLSFIMGLDLVLLTALLFLTGGPTNPFSFFYFVNLSLCAFVASRSAAWVLYGLAVACYTFLLFLHLPLPELQRPESLEPIASRGGISLMQWGLGLAFATCGSVIVHFTSRLHEALTQHEDALRVAESQQARSEKLEALGTLAAGAAHELGSPLSTIAVISRELETQLAHHQARPETLADIALIRSEVERCRKILQRMSHDAGQSIGEPYRTIDVAQFLDRVLEDLPHNAPVHLNEDETLESHWLTVPVHGLAQAVRGLVKNALDASPPGVSVVIAATCSPVQLTVEIRDRGEGMDEDILKRLSEPFFTTKEPGQGMGLGVFLARTTIERLGGQLTFQSTPHQGTVAVITLPLAASPTGSPTGTVAPDSSPPNAIGP